MDLILMNLDSLSLLGCTIVGNLILSLLQNSYHFRSFDVQFIEKEIMKNNKLKNVTFVGNGNYVPPQMKSIFGLFPLSASDKTFERRNECGDSLLVYNENLPSATFLHINSKGTARIEVADFEFVDVLYSLKIILVNATMKRDQMN